MALNLENNVEFEIASGISSVSSVVSVKFGKETLLPTVFPFKLTLVKFDALGVVVRREVVNVTNRVGAVCTISRAYEAVPINDSATTLTQVAYAFDEGDHAYMTVTAGMMKTMQTDINSKLNKSGELRSGLTASRIISTNGSGSETYIAPGASNTFLANDLTFKTVDNIPFIFGDGSDGALVITSGTTNLNLNQVYNYSSISISVGATLSTAGTNGEMQLKCNGLTTLSGTISLIGKNTSPLAIASAFGDIPALALGTGGAGGKGGRTTLGGNGGTTSTPYGAGGGGGGSDWAGTYNGGLGGNGGTPIGAGGTAGSASNGGAGGISAGGGGAGANGPSAGGAGGGGAYGTAGVASPNVQCGGGGGAGGTFGNSGANLKLHTSTITGTGTINTSGSVGGNGGVGGATGTSNNGGGGGGGGGGAGGCGGHIQIIVASGSVFAGTATRAGAAGGTGGTGGVGSSSNAVTGSNGTAGSSGTLVNSLQKSIIY